MLLHLESVVLFVPDIDAAAAWYAALLGDVDLAGVPCRSTIGHEGAFTRRARRLVNPTGVKTCLTSMVS
jgi:hypothetical protein